MISGDAPIRRSNCGAQNTHGAPTSTATVSPRMMAWTPATAAAAGSFSPMRRATIAVVERLSPRSEEHTSELQSRLHLACRLLLAKTKTRHLHTDPLHRR